MFSRQDALFDHHVTSKSTLLQSDLRNLTSVHGGKLPAYLSSACPFGLREGRCLKTRMRLGCHELNCSASRKLGNRRGVD